MASASPCNPKNKDDKKGKDAVKARDSKHHANPRATIPAEDVVPLGEFNPEARALIDKKLSRASTVNWDQLEESLKK